MTPKKKTKKVKAWAVIYDSKFWMAFEKREHAKRKATNPYDKVIPCTITYEID